jgi:predicted small secreted protein
MKHIYLIKESENNYYKVGVSGNINQRIKQLQTGSAGTIELIEKYPSKYSHKIEKALHRKYQQYNVKGEWFNLPESMLNDFIKDCEMYNNGFNCIFNESTLYDNESYHNRL